jgi:hypothetical protein
MRLRETVPRLGPLSTTLEGGGGKEDGVLQSFCNRYPICAGIFSACSSSMTLEVQSYHPTIASISPEPSAVGPCQELGTVVVAETAVRTAPLRAAQSALFSQAGTTSYYEVSSCLGEAHSSRQTTEISSGSIFLLRITVRQQPTFYLSGRRPRPVFYLRREVV